MPSEPRVTLQELVENGHLDTVPEDFLVAEKDRVKLTEDGAAKVELPVIDMAGVEHGVVVEQIRRACEQWGFFQVKNHGVDLQLMSRTQQVFREFFELPYEDRNKIRAVAEHDALPDEGYGDRFGVKESNSANWSDRLRLYTFPVSGRRYELWPQHPPSFRDTVEDYCEEADKLTSRISELISESLGLEPEFLNDYFAGRSQQVLQVNYYPPCPQPDVTMGLRKHSDNNSITLLLQDATVGLQVKKDDQWVTVKPVEGWFVVNVGDQIEILSNGRYRSVEHRAFVSAKPRMSIATFSAPADDTVVGPIPELLRRAEERPRFRAIKFSKFKKSFYYAGWAKAPSGKDHLGHLLIDQD
uniref:Leucoanthocyanidin dioxygenase n=1 Tax=Pohlia nutans TaxID=140635 RepID=A0A4P8JJ54_9BRYO|nr:leucoanthocyanidin dioxygenase [Pohlia nutans]